MVYVKKRQGNQVAGIRDNYPLPETGEWIGPEIGVIGITPVKDMEIIRPASGNR